MFSKRRRPQLIRSCTSDAVELVGAGRDPLVQGLHVGGRVAQVEVGQGVGPQPGRVECDLSDDSWIAVTRADHVTRPGVSIHYIYN